MSPFAKITQALEQREGMEEVRALLAKMSAADLLKWDADYESWMQDGQIEPGGEGWRTWLMMAGRGYGKTRAGAEWITGLATARRPVRIALVGATDAEVRKVMIEGESGLLAVGRRRGRTPRWEPSLGRLTWRGGSSAEIFSGEAPDRLRGPQHHFAWCDELAKWARPEETWDNLQMTLRAGPRPRALVTTTPRGGGHSGALLKKIEKQARTVTTRGRTDDNLTLPDAFLDAMVETYGGTRLGRQELGGEMIEDVEGALWTRALIERCRIILPFEGRWQAQPDGGVSAHGIHPRPLTPLHHAAPFDAACGGARDRHGPPPLNGKDFRRIVIGVDPPASSGGDACGIVACGIGSDGIGYVLGDHSAGGLSPEGWAGRVVAAAEAWSAERVVVENNQGGEMAEAVLRTAAPDLPVRPVRARFGKAQRAEPVAILFERGKVRIAGAFPELEDELAGMTSGGYRGPGRSPDRADAMVWALSELMLGKARAEPRILVL